ncbi:MAG: Hsp20/alpha crystallin family protein [Ferruginibacter sp.]|nr:Hsp20/alpha crystallin family protein [Ferruginibacter sp.]
MSIIKRNGNQLPGFPGFFNDFITKDLWNWGLENSSLTGTTIPAVNIRENNENFLVEMAAPGMNKHDFKVELNGNSLTITSEKNFEEEPKEEERYSRKEFSYQSFSRIFTLPKDVVDADKIEAKYENGVLYLVIPKKEEAKQKGPRLIQIS